MNEKKMIKRNYIDRSECDHRSKYENHKEKKSIIDCV